MARYDVKVNRSYTERDCPPCPTTQPKPIKSCGCSKCRGKSSSSDDGSAAIGFAVIGFVILMILSAIFGRA
jgi:hypothetical protein